MSLHMPRRRLHPGVALALACCAATSSHAQTFTRTDTTVYRDDLSAWVLGQVQSQSSTGVLRDNPTAVETDRTEFDARGLPWKIYKFGKLQQTLTYNADGTLATVADGKNNVTTLSGWKRGIPQTIAFADNTSKSAVVNDDGTIASVADELGNRTCYQYDGMGRVSQITYPSETAVGVCDASRWAPTTITYAAIQTDEYGIPAGHWRRLEQTGNYRKLTYYDAMLRPIVDEDVDMADTGNTNRWTSRQYDDDGRLTFTSYPRNPFQQGSVVWNATIPGTRTVYDALGRTKRVEQDSELGVLAATTEYLPGLQVRTTNPRQQVTVNAYQAFDQPGYEQLIWSVMPEGAVTEIYRNTLGTPFSIRRRNTDSTLVSTRQYVYDGYQQLCKTIEPETGATAYGYDAAGNLEWFTSGLAAPGLGDCGNAAASSSGRAIWRGYDQRNRLRYLRFTDHNGDQDWTYTPDGKPQSVTTWNDGGSTTVVNAYNYNARRLLDAESSTQPGWYAWGLGYGYDRNGNLSTQSYPTGLVVSYAPNALGLPTAVTSTGGDQFATGIKYYPNGAIKQFTYGNGIVHSMTPNARQLPAYVTDMMPGVTAAGGEYRYDENGNNTYFWSYVDNVQRSRSAMYDGLDRLIASYSPIFGGDGWHRFSYDALDNIKSWKLAGVKDYANYYYDPNNQRLTSIQNSAGATVVGFDYDAQGNLSNKNGKGYLFDSGNRLRQVAGATTYRYDAHGRRVLEYAPSGNIVSMYSQSGQLMLDTDARRSVTGEKIYLSGSLIALRDHSWTTNQYTVKYQHTDALGSPVAVTNQAGQVIERTDWEPYGAAIGKPAYQGIGFTGHVMDGATGLTYMQQRYYDPAIGRFLSVDPVTALEKPLTNFNRYAYAFNNPYKFTDPDGRNGVTAFGGLLQESWNALNGRGFDGQMVLGALKDGYDGEGDGFASSAFQDATSFIPTGAVLGSVGKIGLLAREASLLSKTAEGATRIGAASLRGGALSRAEIAATRTLGKQFTQNNGARAFVTKTADGRFNVAFFGKKGYMTSMKNLSEKSLLKQAAKYEWKVK